MSNEEDTVPQGLPPRAPPTDDKEHDEFVELPKSSSTLPRLQQTPSTRMGSMHSGNSDSGLETSSLATMSSHPTSTLPHGPMLRDLYSEYTLSMASQDTQTDEGLETPPPSGFVATSTPKSKHHSILSGVFGKRQKARGTLDQSMSTHVPSDQSRGERSGDVAQHAPKALITSVDAGTAKTQVAGAAGCHEEMIPTEDVRDTQPIPQTEVDTTDHGAVTITGAVDAGLQPNTESLSESRDGSESETGSWYKPHFGESGDSADKRESRRPKKKRRKGVGIKLGELQNYFYLDSLKKTSEPSA